MKSYVSMEQQICPVCCKVFDSGAILVDKQLKASMEDHTITGYDLCKDCKKFQERGFIALVELHGRKSVKPILLKDAAEFRTGNYAHIKKEAFVGIFTCPPPDNGVAFIDVGTIDKLREMQEGA